MFNSLGYNSLTHIYMQLHNILYTFLEMEPKVGSEIGHTNEEISKCDAIILDLPFSFHFQLFFQHRDDMFNVAAYFLNMYMCEMSSCNEDLCEENAGIHSTLEPLEN